MLKMPGGGVHPGALKFCGSDRQLLPHLPMTNGFVNKRRADQMRFCYHKVSENYMKGIKHLHVGVKSEPWGGTKAGFYPCYHVLPPGRAK